mgnify:CR=1 FL=1
MKYVCSICGYVYDEAAEKVKWADLPADWKCPVCGAPKAVFQPQQPAPAPAPAMPQTPAQPQEEDLRELSYGELSALCSNLARGCEKQYMAKEQALFSELAEYYKAKVPPQPAADAAGLLAMAREDLARYPAAADTARAEADRGALRILVWSEKVTRMLESILARYEREGAAFLEHTRIYVCDICGFVYVGDTPPDICPVCKVPSFKILQVEREG